jgi:predicted nucleic acid-binding protein
MRRRFLYDTAVFVYAAGAEHRYRDPCREVVARAMQGELRGEASVDLLQEVVHQFARQLRNRQRATQAAEEVGRLCHLHPLRQDDVIHGLGLFAEHPSLGARDAVFAAVALNRGIDAILSTDRAFDSVPGLERIDPADLEAISALADPA